jgi:hypothetical protein
VCVERFPRGVPGGGRYAPPSYVAISAPGGSPGLTGFGATPQIFFFGRFLLFLAILLFLVDL